MNLYVKRILDIKNIVVIYIYIYIDVRTVTILPDKIRISLLKRNFLEP